MWESLSSVFDRLTVGSVVTTVVDLALVYYLIYRLLLTIRGTRAAQMVVGLVFVGAAFYAAERLELSTVSWLLDNFISSVIIIVIVVFQADIRRALGRLGQGILPLARGAEAVVAVDEVANAVQQLARARIGAIIVFEREAALREFVDDASRVDALVSRQLLVALFLPSPHNELHDGAIVLDRRRRIALARALLPLSRATDLGPEFGTRHRAALGITEDTDAVAVVVSEERGEISLCLRGSIARDLDTPTLRRALHGIFEAGQSNATAAEAEAAVEIGRAVASMGAGRAATTAPADPVAAPADGGPPPNPTEPSP
ncbi:MAG: diadenylate cyclase CdaA [Kofleriaceae bacterium]